MSVRVIGMIWDKFPHGGSKLIVMQALADIGGDDGRGIWAGYDYLAVKCRMSKRQLQRVIIDLIKEGWILQTSDPVPGRKIVRDRFRIDVEKVTDCPALLHKKQDITGKKVDIEGKKVDITSPESAPVSQSGSQPYLTVYNRKAGDSKIDESIAQYRAFIACIKRAADPDPKILKEAEEQLNKLVVERDRQPDLLEQKQ